VRVSMKQVQKSRERLGALRVCGGM